MGEFTSEGATSQRWETIKMEKKLPKLIPLVVLFVANLAAVHNYLTLSISLLLKF